MRSGTRAAWMFMITAMVVLWFAPATAGLPQYVEDFSTKTYCDTLSTTANWDTVSGTLGLHPFQVARAGTCDTPDQARGVAISGDHAFVADHGSGLQIIDISDPANPVVVGSYDTPGYAQDVAVAGDYAYVIDGVNGLRAIDISDPTTPFGVDYIHTGGYAAGVAISGDHAFVADNDTGLQVVDISDPSNLILVGGYATPGIPYGVAVDGDHAFVADASAGLQVFDISDPTFPTLAGTYDTPGSAYDVAVAGDYAYVADNNEGLRVVDISDPTSPVSVGSVPTTAFARGVVVAGDYAYVADLHDGLQVIDISDPANPTIWQAQATGDYAYGVAVDGEHAYVAAKGTGLEVITVAAPTPPMPVAYDAVGSVRDVVVAGDYAYVADGGGRLRVVDIADPNAPNEVGLTTSINECTGVSVSGNYAYMAVTDSGLHVVDISDPVAASYLPWVGACATSGQALDVVVAGDYAYVAADTAGLQVIDVSDPTNPVPVGSCDTPGSAQRVVVAGDHAYLADYGAGLQVIDISNPLAPVAAGDYDTPSLAFDVAVAGDYACVADYSSGLQVIDISDPTNPTPVGSYDTPGFARGVALSGDYALVADWTVGLQVIDISDPTQPVLFAAYGLGLWSREVAVAGDYAYVAGWASSSYLQVVEVFQRVWEPDANTARSLDLEPLGAEVLRARMSATQTDSIAWELSADGGTNWERFIPGADWKAFAVPGSGLLWRSTHVYPGLGVNPVCTGLTIEWIYSFPVIASVQDVPGDQGRQVRVNWGKSGHDVIGDPSQITEYSLYRRIDDAAKAGAISIDGGDPPDLSTNLLGWDYVLSVPADAEDEYSVVVPTLADSTIAEGMQWSAFMVRARVEPGVFYDSPADSGYSLDNLAPAPPEGLLFASGTLSWDEAQEADFDYFTIYGSDKDVLDESAVLLDATSGTSSDVSAQPYAYYHVTTVDFAGNEGEAATVEGQVTGVGDPGARQYLLRANAPNPFSSSTAISFSLAEETFAEVSVYDLSGQLVRRLLAETLPAGEHLVTWDGRDTRARPVAAGVYLYRLHTADFDRTRSMVRLR